MAKVRKQIYLEERQNQKLKRLAEARGVSEAEVIREAIERETEWTANRYLPYNPTALEELLKAARERRQLGITGEPYRWNRDDGYEERLSRWDRRD